MIEPSLPIAVIGAGPVGLAAAAQIVSQGLVPVVFERGAGVGASLREWSHVRVFSPWQYDIDAAARDAARDVRMGGAGRDRTAHGRGKSSIATFSCWLACPSWRLISTSTQPSPRSPAAASTRPPMPAATRSCHSRFLRRRRRSGRAQPQGQLPPPQRHVGGSVV